MEIIIRNMEKYVVENENGNELNHAVKSHVFEYTKRCNESRATFPFKFRNRFYLTLNNGIL